MVLSLVLNGGIGGSGTTQTAYLASRVASSLPAIISFWHRAGINSGATGRVANIVDASAAVGTFRLGSSLSRSVGPVFNNTTAIFNETGTTSSFSTRSDLTDGRYRYPVTSIAAGATTTITVDTLGDAMPYAAGMYVRIDGTLTGLAGILAGREYRVSSVSGATAVLEVATTGTLEEGWSAFVRWSAWQPERWNLGVVRISGDRDPERMQYWGGFLGSPGITIYSATPGVFSPSLIWDVMDRICFGGLYQSDTINSPFRGELAHLAVWQEVDLDDSKAAELLTVAPNLVSWGTPLAYVPCIDNGTATVGAENLTTVGSPSFTSDGPSITLTGGGGGSGTFIPSVMRAQPINIFGF